MRPDDPALRALSDAELVARRDVLAVEQGRERSRLAFLRGIARRYNAHAPPPEVDVAATAAEAMRKEAIGALRADELWELAGWRRELATIDAAILALRCTPTSPSRERRLERLQAEAEMTASKISEREAAPASSHAEVRRLLAVIAEEHIRVARRREFEATQRATEDIDACKERLQSVTQQLALIRREIRGRMRLVKVEAFLARRGYA